MTQAMTQLAFASQEKCLTPSEMSAAVSKPFNKTCQNPKIMKKRRRA